MEAKEKAKELYDKFHYEIPSYDNKGELEQNSVVAKFATTAKQCALICVDEILKEEDNMFSHRVKYWKEVKQEINKL